MTFAEKLRELRTAKGLSQKDLADKVNVTQAAIAHWEAGRKIPAFDSVQSLCKALSVRCTVFDDCEYAADDEPRSPGRPPKADAELSAEVTKQAAKGKKPNKKGSR